MERGLSRLLISSRIGRERGRLGVSYYAKGRIIFIYFYFLINKEGSGTQWVVEGGSENCDRADTSTGGSVERHGPGLRTASTPSAKVPKLGRCGGQRGDEASF